MRFATIPSRLVMDTAPPSPRRWPVALAVVIGLALAGRFLFAVDAPTDVVTLPDAGLVRAAQLSDGTPVFLAHLDDGSAHVVEAFSPAGGGPVGALVGWCPAARQFVDPHLGAQFDPTGQRFADAAVPGRAPAELIALPDPGPADDLTRRDFERLDGRGDAEDPMRVGAPIQPDPTAPRTEPLTPLADGRPMAPPPVCQVEPDPLVEVVDDRPLSRTRLLDHSFQARLLRTPRDGWQITDGYALVAPDGAITWCRVEPEGLPPTCPDPAPVTVDVDVTAADTGGGWAVIGGPLAVRVADRIVVEMAALPLSTWRGSSLRGGATFDVEVVRVRLDPGKLTVTAEADDRPACAGDGPGPFEVGLTVDTLVNVAGAADPQELEGLLVPGPDDAGPPVLEATVTVDAVTCAALSLTD